MSNCVGATRMPACQGNYPFGCSTIRSPDNVPIEFATGNGFKVRFVFLNYQSRKHLRQQSCSRPHVVTARLDNARDNRVAAKRCVVSGADDTIGVSQSSAERCFHKRKRGFGSSHCYTATFHSEHGCRGIKRRRNAMVVCNR